MRRVPALLWAISTCSFTPLALGASDPAPPPAAPPPIGTPPAAAPIGTPPPAAAPAAAPIGTPPPAAPRATANDARPARTGFQAAFRTGFSLPFGDATGVPSDTLVKRYAWQVPIVFDLGAKVTRDIFIGSYLHFGFGSEGSDAEVSGYCDDNDSNFENDVSCSVVTIRLGLEGNYQFQPDQRINPWLGYGFGFESAIQSLTDRQRGYSETNTTSGFTFAQLAGGFDYRALVGFGPFAELALGRFTKTTVEQNGHKVFSGSIDDRAWHAWLTIGVRMVVRP